MPQVIVTRRAIAGIERCRRFLQKAGPDVLLRAAAVIDRNFALLETSPAAGRPFDEISDLRELVIPFGETGYVALYRHDTVADMVYILAFRHQREAGY